MILARQYEIENLYEESGHLIKKYFICPPILASRPAYTVELRSKGPGRKGIPPIREIFSSPYLFLIGYMGISV